MSNVNVSSNDVCIAQQRSIFQAFSLLRFDERATFRVRNPKDGRGAK